MHQIKTNGSLDLGPTRVATLGTHWVLTHTNTRKHQDTQRRRQGSLKLDAAKISRAEAKIIQYLVPAEPVDAAVVAGVVQREGEAQN